MTRIAPVPSTKRWLIVACDRPLLPGLSAFSNHWVKVSICNLILAESGQRAASCSNGWLGKHSPDLRHGTQFWLLGHLLLNHGSPVFMLFIKSLSCLYDPVKVHKTNILIEPNYKVCSKSFPWDKKRQLWCLPRLGSLSPAAWPRPAPPPPPSSHTMVTGPTENTMAGHNKCPTSPAHPIFHFASLA